MLSVYADHNRSTRTAPARTRIATFALIGAVLFVSNPTAHGQRPNPPALPSIAGPWGAIVPNDRNATVTIAPGPARGTYTIHGVWAPDRIFPNGSDWGTALLNLGQVTQAGFSASATLHGFYPTLDVQLEFNWASKSTMILKLRSHNPDNSVAAVFAPMTFRRMGLL
jgi:hypothetical protein